MDRGNSTISEEQVLHASAYFTGHVQGVGFRYQTFQIAKEYELSGFVRNLADGRVQLEAEGEATEVRAFVTAVQERLGDYIRKTEAGEQWRVPVLKGFTISY